MGPYQVIMDDCDNNGVVLHCNTHSQPLSASPKQSDVLRVMKKFISCQPFVIKFLYVQSHTDDIKWSECTIKERMNIKVDDRAKRALIHAHATNEFFDGIYPLDNFVISMGGQKMTGPMQPALEAHWERREAQQFFDFKQIVHTWDFDLIWWDDMRKAMENYPKMCCVFVSKQVLGWCDFNSKQSL
jgi:hypothetical protein